LTRFQALTSDLVKLVRAKRASDLGAALGQSDVRRITAERHQTKENILAHGQVCAVQYALDLNLSKNLTSSPSV
jgi:hypothetical protein